MKIQVLFGSNSDERVYGPLCHSLEKCGEVKMTVASAHRNSDLVHEVVKTCGADVFVAGAGLAAHLPGVVASLTKKPVVGVAVNGAFGGLDAFLSIVQMPKGVPVMAVTEDNTLKVADTLIRWKNLPHDVINLHWNRNMDSYPALQKALADIKELSGVNVAWVAETDPACLGEIVSPWETPKTQGLNLFVCDKTQLQNMNLAVDFFMKARQCGLWVGANNIGNFVNQWNKLLEIGN